MRGAWVRFESARSLKVGQNSTGVDILTVTTLYGRKSAEIAPRVAHETLARQLLQELVQQEKARKGSTL